MSSLLDQVIDYRHGGVEKDLVEIAAQIEDWEESLPATLGLKPADVAHVKNKHKDNLKLQTIAALRKWKQCQGANATYRKLIELFQNAGLGQVALFVYRLTNDYLLNTKSAAATTHQQNIWSRGSWRGLYILGVIVLVAGVSIPILYSVYMYWTTPDHKEINSPKPQDHLYDRVEPNIGHGEYGSETSGLGDSSDICKGQPEMESKDQSELSKIIGANGNWKEWCKHLGVSNATCNAIEHSGDNAAVLPLNVAEAYVKQLSTCWKKVVLVLCKKLAKPNCQAARDVAIKHGIDYTTVCTSA